MSIEPICLYTVLTIILPVLFCALRWKRYLWGSIVSAVVIELLVYRDEFSYYEGRSLMLLLTIAQIAAMALFILILRGNSPPTNPPREN